MIIREFKKADQNLTIQETIGRYILNLQKAPNALIGGAMVGPNCIESIIDMKELFDYPDDLQLKHFILTFGPNYATSTHDIVQLASDITTIMGYTNQALYAVHEDTAPAHAHIIINPICHQDGHLWGQTEAEIDQFIAFAMGYFLYNYCI